MLFDSQSACEETLQGFRKKIMKDGFK